MIEKVIKKRINFNFSKQKLILDTSQSLFSSVRIDEGTIQLLNSLRKNNLINYKKILDLGCGYGVVGIFLKKQNPKSNIDSVDKDSLAVDFTSHNAKLNLCEINAFGSLFYESITSKYSLIITNFPAKAGLKCLKYVILNASQYLEEDGIFCIVIVKELEDNFKKILNENLGIEIIFNQKSKGYSIYHLKYKKIFNYAEDPYIRNLVNFRLDDQTYKLKTVFGLKEFESPNYSTLSLINLLRTSEKYDSITIMNPHQGHTAIIANHYLHPKKIFLISNDLLTLKYSRLNLNENGFSNIDIINQYLLDKKIGDFLIYNSKEKEEDKILEDKIKTFLGFYKKIIITGKKSQIFRIIKNKKITKQNEIKGYVALEIKN